MMDKMHEAQLAYLSKFEAMWNTLYKDYACFSLDIFGAGQPLKELMGKIKFKYFPDSKAYTIEMELIKEAYLRGYGLGQAHFDKVYNYYLGRVEVLYDYGKITLQEWKSLKSELRIQFNC